MKFEWAIGAVLSGGPENRVVFVGEGGSGKSTLSKIVRHILTRFIGDTSPRVAFVNWDFHYELPPFEEGLFVFTESNVNEPVLSEALGTLVIHTTGQRMPVNRHYVLMSRIESELDEIAQICIDLYADLGEDYYSIQENQA